MFCFLAPTYLNLSITLPGHTVLVALVPCSSCGPLAFLILVLLFVSIRMARSFLLWLCPSDSLILLQASERPLGCAVPFSVSQFPSMKDRVHLRFSSNLWCLSHVSCPAVRRMLANVLSFERRETCFFSVDWFTSFSSVRSSQSLCFPTSSRIS